MMKPIILLTASMLALAACGGPSEEAATPDTKVAATAIDEMAEHDMSDHSGSMGEGLAHGEGRIVSVDLEGRRIEIDHGPLAGADMAAMTMAFGTTGNVDLATLSAGDEVMFMVKQGRDGSWRVTHICDQGTEMSDCMAEMDH
ncbi:copper-binding protein [Parvularcula sp. LCG005]|uniref:copper-binding protein n=1 Tax=Parvularcula sp. LCG005 TaxID=3078805 RepID=UPI0029423279|nr:copper-binding protein [Parvularcula sp. LCG005]WOI52181.1 copper-binding protein [Parvularcula sp. LCG005]